MNNEIIVMLTLTVEVVWTFQLDCGGYGLFDWTVVFIGANYTLVR